MLPLCGERKRFCVLMNFAEVLGIAHRPSMKRQNMSGGASLTHKIYLTDGAHPGLYKLVYLLLMRNVTLRIRKSLGAVEKGAIFHLEEKPSYFVARARAGTINELMCLGPPFFPTNYPQHRKSPPSVGLGLKWKRLLKR